MEAITRRGLLRRLAALTAVVAVAPLLPAPAQGNPAGAGLLPELRAELERYAAATGSLSPDRQRSLLRLLTAQANYVESIAEQDRRGVGPMRAAGPRRYATADEVVALARPVYLPFGPSLTRAEGTV